MTDNPRSKFEEALANHSARWEQLGGDPTGESTMFMIDEGPRPDESEILSGLVCKICHQTLDVFQEPGGVTSLIHPRSWVKYDHEPEPIEVPADFKRDVLCDFCGQQQELYWSISGGRLMRRSGSLIQDHGGRWGACETCGEFLKANDLESMLDRNMKEASREGLDAEGQRLVRAEILAMWIRFLGTATEMAYIGPRRVPARLHPRLMPKLLSGLVKFWTFPRLHDMILKRDHRFSLPGVHAGDPENFRVSYASGSDVPTDAWRNHVVHLTSSLWQTAADDGLYWISPDFTRLAIMAGHDFDKIVLTAEQLPSKHGFLIWDGAAGEMQRPGGRAAICAVTWTSVPGGIWLNIYVQGEDSDPEVDVTEMRAKLGWLHCPNAGAGIAFGDEIDIPDDAEYNILRTIFATWFLIQQPGVAETQSAPVDKKEARRYQRAHNRRQPDVKLVNLRHQPRRTNQDEEHHEGRKLTVRVYRRGHWKRQFYGPKRGLRKMIYVNGYIAGPDGAPLKSGTPTIKVLR